MTGFGEAHRQQQDLAVAIEVRTVNSRYFKLSLRSAEGYSALEPQIEQLVRQQIKRGTVQVLLHVARTHQSDDFKVNIEVAAGYRRQLEALQKSWQLADGIKLEALVMLPGVIEDSRLGFADVEKDWPTIEQTLRAALENLSRMRRDEGTNMAADLRLNAGQITASLAQIELRAPTVAGAYRARLVERVGKALDEFHVTLQPGDLVREVSIFAERSDISEETVRLRSHLDQFVGMLDDSESSGRKLDFLTQEMFRETNTIGSKASDVEIARHVIDIKAAIERMREMIQNVE